MAERSRQSTMTTIPEAPAPPAIPPRAQTVKTVPQAGDSEALRKKYDELAGQSAAAAKANNPAEVERIKPLKLAAFAAWKDSLKAAELAEKERVRRRAV